MREVPSWDQYFMDIAKIVANRSKDPDTQVGSVLVDSNNHIIGTGYNGFSPGFPEDPLLWRRPEKYKWVIHAEMNCLLHSTKSPRGGLLYVTMFPCQDCCKAVASAGIRRIVYSNDKYKTEDGSRILMNSQVQIDRLTS